MNIFRNIYEGREIIWVWRISSNCFPVFQANCCPLFLSPGFSGRPCGGIAACFIRKVSFLIFSILKKL